MTSTFDASRRTRAISALAVGAILLGLSAPIAHAAPDNGPGTEPWPPNVPSDQYPSLALPPVLASQNPVVFYGSETKKTIDFTWTPYPWGPVQFHYEAVGGTQYVGIQPEVDPSVTDPHGSLQVTYGRTYHVRLQAPWPSELVGPTLTITTVKIGLAPSDPQPPRVDPAPIPGDNRRPEPPGPDAFDDQGPSGVRPSVANQRPEPGSAGAVSS